MGVIANSLARMVPSRMTKPADVPFPSTDGAWQRQFGWSGTQPSSSLDYREEAGNLSLNSAVMACVQWMARTFPEAPIQVRRTTGAGTGMAGHEVVPNHPLTALIKRPNPYYSGTLLWKATMASLSVSGNAYWIKIRSRRGDPVELWYEPHFTCSPTWPVDGSAFIGGYRLMRGGRPYDIARADVVHFRSGIDLANTRLGLSDLASALREVFTDNEAATFSATLLHNMGIPGLVVSPMQADTQINDPAGLKRDIMAKTTGDRRGEPLVMALPTKIEKLSFSPAEMSMREVRYIPEERICALLGIPPGVVGLGAGLDRNTFSNMREGREAAYESCIVPTQRLLANDLDVQLLPDMGDGASEEVAFDLSEVRALQEDRDKLTARTALAYKSGVMRRSEARRALGLETDAGDELFVNELPVIRENLTDVLTAPIDVAQTELAPTTPAQLARANGNGQ